MPKEQQSKLWVWLKSSQSISSGNQTSVQRIWLAIIDMLIKEILLCFRNISGFLSMSMFLKYYLLKSLHLTFCTINGGWNMYAILQWFNDAMWFWFWEVVTEVLGRHSIKSFYILQGNMPFLAQQFLMLLKKTCFVPTSFNPVKFLSHLLLHLKLYKLQIRYLSFSTRSWNFPAPIPFPNSSFVLYIPSDEE